VAIAPNLMKQRLARGDLVIGLGVRQMQSVEIGLIARAAEFDFLFIDLEHSTMDMSRAGEIATAALGQGITPLARVSGHEPHHCVPLLDCGVQGIVTPHVETEAAAQTAVEILKFPPVGQRSMSRSSAMTGYETMPIAEIARQANEECLCIPMVESRLGVENAADIAATAHVDALLIGASDLCADLGLPGEFGHATVVAACEAIIDACRSRGKPCGISGVRDDGLLRHYIERGARMVHAGTDAPLLVEIGRSRTGALRKIATALCK
jgi:2-keto-3-deoxy-L-rhamnonate aldolase RhmA